MLLVLLSNIMKAQPIPNSPGERAAAKKHCKLLHMEHIEKMHKIMH